MTGTGVCDVLRGALGAGATGAGSTLRGEPPNGATGAGSTLRGTAPSGATGAGDAVRGAAGATRAGKTLRGTTGAVVGRFADGFEVVARFAGESDGMACTSGRSGANGRATGGRVTSDGVNEGFAPTGTRCAATGRPDVSASPLTAVTPPGAFQFAKCVGVESRR